MTKSKETILREEYEKIFAVQKYNKSVNRIMNQSYIFPAMATYAKQEAIAFIEYNNKFRREEGRWFKKECDKLGGMFSLADYGVENIYNDFVARKPIRSYLIPDQETFWVFDETGKLIHSMDQNKQS